MTKQKSIFLLLFLCLLTLAILYRDEIDIAYLKKLVDEAGVLAPLIFMLIYTLATILVFPVSLLTLASGALFGPVFGTIYSLTAATFGATFALLISRYFAANLVKQHSGTILKKLINGVNSEGWQFVAFVRLVPLFPFNMVNYAFGLTTIKTTHYFFTSFICMLPGATAYTYLGYLGGSAASGDTEGLIQKILIGLSLLAIAAFIPKWVIKYRKGKEK